MTAKLFTEILWNFSIQALALLGGYIGKGDSTIQIGAIMGLGLAYAGSQNEKVKYLGFILFFIGGFYLLETM